jgi:hypothetical protein
MGYDWLIPHPYHFTCHKHDSSSSSSMIQHYNRCTYQKILKDGTSKVAPLHAMQAYGRIRGTAPFALNLGTSWRWVLDFAPCFSAEERTYGTHWIENWGDPEPVKILWIRDEYFQVPGIELQNLRSVDWSLTQIHYTRSWRWCNANPCCFRVIYHKRIWYTANVSEIRTVSIFKDKQDMNSDWILKVKTASNSQSSAMHPASTQYDHPNEYALFIFEPGFSEWYFCSHWAWQENFLCGCTVTRPPSAPNSAKTTAGKQPYCDRSRLEFTVRHLAVSITNYSHYSAVRIFNWPRTLLLLDTSKLHHRVHKN